MHLYWNITLKCQICCGLETEEINRQGLVRISGGSRRNALKSKIILLGNILCS